MKVEVFLIDQQGNRIGTTEGKSKRLKPIKADISMPFHIPVNISIKNRKPIFKDLITGKVIKIKGIKIRDDSYKDKNTLKVKV